MIQIFKTEQEELVYLVGLYFFSAKINFLGAYDFRHVEKADGIAESNHKNRIYFIHNVTEFGPQQYYLNTNLYVLSVCVNE